jgi:hypothetical protein
LGAGLRDAFPGAVVLVYGGDAGGLGEVFGASLDIQRFRLAGHALSFGRADCPRGRSMPEHRRWEVVRVIVCNRLGDAQR